MYLYDLLVCAPGAVGAGQARRLAGTSAILVAALTLTGCSTSGDREMAHEAAALDGEHAGHGSSESVELPELRDELLAMMKLDQEIRALGHQQLDDTHDDEQGHSTPIVIVSGDEDGHNPADQPVQHESVHGPEMMHVDRDNTLRLKQIIEEHGWPTIPKVGAEGALAAWLIVQHADLDPAFQRRCLEMLQGLPEGSVALSHIAYLTDRVAVNEGRPQVYGTQFTQKDGKMVPQPIEDPEGLDARRAAMKLISMAEYTAHMEGHLAGPNVGHEH